MYGIKVYSLYSRGVDFVRLVMVEKDWSLKVPIPRDHFIDGHFNRRFGGPKAIETAELWCQRAITKG